ncbi:MAG: histidinol dehydrogenase [Clostridiales bacterium]|jgi:histidinol dehydrogenase|nr:histidinol dehydrogenase [Clostridiales bacterium]
MRLNRDLSAIKNRKNSQTNESITASVAAIIADVRKNGDEALRRYAKKYDGFTGTNLALTAEERTETLKRLCGDVPLTIAETGGINFDWIVNENSSDFFRILHRAAERIKEFHKNQTEKSWSIYKENGVMMGQIIRPLERVALYVPGGTAVLTSTLLMCAVPAQLAGVKEIVIFTPVKEDDRVSDEIIQAATGCGITEIYKIGGVHAIAAAAYGTETIPKVDKIVGPGSIFVATAKRLVYGDVDIDMVAGPSDVLVIADETANAKYVAADLLSQAEHDTLASSILISTSEKLISEVEKEIERQLTYLNRKEIIQESLKNFGAAVCVSSIEEAFEISNSLAPEHLEVLTADPISHLPKIKNAGSIFLGENTPEPLGDYMSGTNHVLPTGGTAKFFSPLGVYDFVKHSSYSYYPRHALADLKDDTIKFALSEGLDAHANSIKVRFE